MGFLGVVRFLPWILFTLPAGVWVDRMRRRPILIGADVARAVLLASIPVAFLGGWLTIWQVYVVSFLAGTLEVFFDIAYQSYLPSIVERDELVEGNSKLELSRAASSVVGPTVAGFLIEAVRAPIAILFDALSYLGAVLVRGAHPTPGEPLPPPHDPADGQAAERCGRRRERASATCATAHTCATSPPAPARSTCSATSAASCSCSYLVERAGRQRRDAGPDLRHRQHRRAARCADGRPAGRRPSGSGAMIIWNRARCPASRWSSSRLRRATIRSGSWSPAA